MLLASTQQHSVRTCDSHQARKPKSPGAEHVRSCEEEVGKKLEESSGDNVSDITRHFKNLDDAIDKRLHYKIDYKPTLRCEEWLDEEPWSKQKERCNYVSASIITTTSIDESSPLLP